MSEDSPGILTKVLWNTHVRHNIALIGCLAITKLKCQAENALGKTEIEMSITECKYFTVSTNALDMSNCDAGVNKHK